jgi:hypothetical protein
MIAKFVHSDRAIECLNGGIRKRYNVGHGDAPPELGSWPDRHGRESNING